MVSVLVAVVALTGCDVAQGQLNSGASSPTSFPDVSVWVRPCAIQTAALLTAAELPANLTPESPASAVAGPIGPSYDTSAAAVYPGSVGDTNAYFQWTGFTSHPLDGVPPTGAIYANHPAQVFQLAEEIDDWGTVENAKRWMTSQRLNQGDAVPSLGDDTFMYHYDVGRSVSVSYTALHPGDVYTNIEVRDGTMMFALGIDSGPGADPASRAVSIVRSMMAKERAVCG